jgi:hypothetical protein
MSEDEHHELGDFAPELYTVVDPSDKTKGDLVELMRQALFSKNHDTVDEYIQTRIPDFLLNEGKGDIVSVRSNSTNCAAFFNKSSLKQIEGSNQRAH